MKLIDSIFGTYSERQIRKITPIANKIEDLGDEYRNLTDEQLKGKTQEFKERLANGETLEDILPEAYATVREADDRVLGKRPYYVQVLGGIIIHQGRIAEMKTGEGKTLLETLPAYLNALTGNGVHIVTVNEYLAKRDNEEMGRVFSFLGLTTGLTLSQMTLQDKIKAYQADITYGTNSEFGFDYLRDNLTNSKNNLTQRGQVFAIIDEVDSILIDEARTPLIISSKDTEASDFYKKADSFVRTLKKYVIKELDSKEDMDHIEEDYIVDEKASSATLTQNGVKKAEKYFGLENLSDPENIQVNQYINQSLRAHGIMKNEQDYIVVKGQVFIVDQFTGRVLPGRRYSNGLHQAIEAKERVPIQNESKTIATITYQNYFRLYSKLSGMTGTALSEEAEFREIYMLDVVEIPTNRPMIRIDHPDLVFKTCEGKYKAIVKQVLECQEKGQPILIGTITIEKSEQISRLLTKNGIKHDVLNAKQHEREAEIIAQAGRPGAVTIATNMAGRGTDILLGGNPEFLAKNELRKKGVPEELIQECTGMSDTTNEELLSVRQEYKNLFDEFKEKIQPDAKKVVEAGGLYILGTERHESRRIDNQLRGRSGRQGDPGESCFFISLEDDLVRIFGEEVSNKVNNLLGMKLFAESFTDENSPLFSKPIANMVERAQKAREAANFNHRKTVLTYDDVIDVQRKTIYKERTNVLNGKDIHQEIENMMNEFVTDSVCKFIPDDYKEGWNILGFQTEFANKFFPQGENPYTENKLLSMEQSEIIDVFTELAFQIYHQKEALVGEERMRDLERMILLSNVNRYWMYHIDEMDDLKERVGLNSYAQRSPIDIYKIQAAEMFDEMISNIRHDTINGILSVRIETRMQVNDKAAPMVAGFQSATNRPKAPQMNMQVPRPEAKPVPIKNATKVNPNDPCPCGSGRKYKKCCGLGGPTSQGE